MAEKLKVIALGAAVNVVTPGQSGKPMLRQAGFDENGKPVLEPATRVVFLERGDELPDNLADGEADRLKALDPPAVGSQADLDWLEQRLATDRSTTPSWAQQLTGYPGTLNEEPSPARQAEQEQLANLPGLSDEELVGLYEGKPPTVKALVAAVGDDPALAQRVLGAESTATKGDVRATLREGLEKVIAAGAAAPPQPEGEQT